MTTNNTIPEQREGNSSDVEQHYDASTLRQAHSAFVEAAHRLINVNNWKEISGALSATFQLTDHHGTPLDRVPKPGDFIQIDIPGPGTATGHGYDWVQIETIDDNPDPNGEQESFTITVRPVPSPLNNEPDVAHFFDDKATSSFVVKRNGLRVTAAEHGRNEIPNKGVERTTDKVRNTMVANAATSGLSALQWNWLVQGVLKDL
jgi:hypothetical protein